MFSEDIDQLASAPIPPCATFDGNYSKFFYSPRAIPEDDTVMVSFGAAAFLTLDCVSVEVIARIALDMV